MKKYVFDFRERERAITLPPSPLLSFLCGEPVELTPELSVAISAEFTAQEKYRQLMAEGIEAAIKAIMAMASESSAAHETPYATAADAYWRGYDAGVYAASVKALDALASTINDSAIGVEE